MAFPFKSILVPVDFDPSSLKALELGAKVARQNNGKVFVLHIVPVDIDVSDMPQYAELITHQEGLDREKLTPDCQAVSRRSALGDSRRYGSTGRCNRQRRAKVIRGFDRDGHARSPRLGATGGREHRRKSAAPYSVPGPCRPSRPLTLCAPAYIQRRAENRAPDQALHTHPAEWLSPSEASPGSCGDRI